MLRVSPERGAPSARCPGPWHREQRIERDAHSAEVKQSLLKESAPQRGRGGPEQGEGPEGPANQALAVSFPLVVLVAPSPPHCSYWPQGPVWLSDPLTWVLGVPAFDSVLCPMGTALHAVCRTAGHQQSPCPWVGVSSLQ